MANLPPRYGDDTWYAVIGYEGDPHILAYRRDHPDHTTVPLRWKNPPPRQDTPAPPPPRPPAPGRWATRADPVRLPRPDEMLTVAEVKAIMAEARAASAPDRGPDDLLIPVQGNRGPRGPAPSAPLAPAATGPRRNSGPAPHRHRPHPPGPPCSAPPSVTVAWWLAVRHG